MGPNIKNIATFAFSLTLLSLCAFTSHAGKDKKDKPKKKDLSDTIPFILEHTLEIKVTADQLRKLEQLEQAEEKVMSDPAVKAVLMKLRAAKKSGDDKEFADQKQHLADKIKERTGGQITSFKTSLGLILSPEQLKIFNDLHGNSTAAAEKDMKDPKSDSATPGKALNPFEF